jgi:hypothetical protein
LKDNCNIYVIFWSPYFYLFILLTSGALTYIKHDELQIYKMNISTTLLCEFEEKLALIRLHGWFLYLLKLQKPILTNWIPRKVLKLWDEYTFQTIYTANVWIFYNPSFGQEKICTVWYWILMVQSHQTITVICRRHKFWREDKNNFPRS